MKNEKIIYVEKIIQVCKEIGLDETISIKIFKFSIK